MCCCCYCCCVCCCGVVFVLKRRLAYGVRRSLFGLEIVIRDKEYSIVIAFTFVIGGYLGSKLSLSLPPQTVRRVFGVIMLLGAIKLISSK